MGNIDKINIDVICYFFALFINNAHAAFFSFNALLLTNLCFMM